MNYLNGEIVLVSYPISNLLSQKVRPAIIVSGKSAKHGDVFIVPLTSKTNDLEKGEFILLNWQDSGLNVQTAVKRGCLLIDQIMIRQKIGTLSEKDLTSVKQSLKFWLDL